MWTAHWAASRKKMETEVLTKFKYETSDEKDFDNFEIEYEILPAFEKEKLDPRITDIEKKIAEIDAQSEELYSKIESLNSEIERLTNHADVLDYLVAVVSGIIAGMVDSCLVGETEINKDKIQETLENKYHTANDNGFTHKTKDGHQVDSPMYHRLDDLAHHPTLLGLVASILSRYLRLVIFIDGTDGKPHIFFSDTSSGITKKREIKDLMQAWVGAVIGGICLWLVHVAEKKYEEINDEEMPKLLKKIVRTIGSMPMIIEILKAVDVWAGHMMSDVSTSQGIPGIFLSLLKELSVLPFLRNTNFKVKVDKLYRKGNNNLSEWGGVVFTAAKKQAIPVLINETITRSFYFVRHLIEEYKEHNEWKSINWENVIPFRNRTIVRMLTISSGTFTAIDLADAAIRSAIEAGPPTTPAFWSKFVLKVNFVGVGRFVIAVGTDIGMRIKRQKLIKERMQYRSENGMLQIAKLFYMQEGMWIEAIDTEKTMNDLCDTAENSILYFMDSFNDISKSIDNMDNYISDVKEKNPKLIEDMKDILEWG